MTSDRRVAVAPSVTSPVAPPVASPAARRVAAEDGNTLLLFPAAMLVMLVLSAVAIDFALMYSTQREVATLADGVARAATGAVDEQRLFDDGTYAVDLARANAAATAMLASRPEERIHLTCGPPRHGASLDEVEIDCRGTSDLIFRQALGGDRSFSVTATGRARAAEAP